MAGLADLLHIAASGLNAATEAIKTVSNNTANVNTPGYNVQLVRQTERPGLPGGVGAGTDVTGIARAFDRFVAQQLVRAGSANQAAQVLQTAAQNLSSLFPVASGGEGGLGSGIDGFFSALGQVANDPSNVANRSVLIGAAQTLTGQFNTLGSQLAQQLSGIDGQTATAVQQVNSLTQQIARLNKTIIAQTAGSGTAANGLLDQRDQLVNQLGQAIGVTVVRDTSGGLDIYTAGGAALVNDTVATSLRLQPDAYGSGANEITDAATGEDLTPSIGGGTLGGLIAARTLVVQARDSVGGIAVALAQAVNTQQQLGLDLNGNSGGSLFTVASPQVYAASANSGSAALTATISDPNSLEPGNLVVTKTATGFEATDPISGQVTDLGNGPTLTVAGLTISVSGNAAVGDSFEIAPVASAAQTLKLVATDPAAIAAASAYVATGGDNVSAVNAAGQGTVTAAALPAGAVTVAAAAFGQDLTIKFTSQTDFQVLGPGNGVIASGSLDANGAAEIAIAYPDGGHFAVFAVSGGPAAAGDTIRLTPGGGGSNGNVAALAALASVNLVAGQTLDGGYASLVGTIGQRSQGAQIAAQAAQGVLTQAQSAQQSVSGVNLDEQAADLVSFQQAYQASAQVIATAQSLFENLLSAVQR